MKYCFIVLLFGYANCFGQKWEAELLVGVSGYKGDLTEKFISTKSIKPAFGFNVKNNLNDVLILRAGMSYARISATDKNNKRSDLKSRNLSFTTNIIEANFCVEVNIFEPEFFNAYPYVFGGIGLYHFNPYTFDDDNVKNYLQPLGTEGQGLAAYPGRKPYSLTQFCFPIGGGMKIKISRKCDLVYEFGARLLLTDYLDDVSTTYVSNQTLLDNHRPKAAELAYRQAGIPLTEGDIRGNPDVKDFYFISGFKWLLRLGKAD